ncbi:MAG TPA: CoA transferase [Bacteroidetes bacterium]|nr:CoA transferase [Bacteroidota bacterium]
MTAYGPEDKRAGYDAIIQAESGYYSMNGSPDGPAQKMPLAFMDLLAAHQLKEGILLALLKRAQTGAGSHVQTSLIGAGISSLANQATNWLVGGVIPQRMGSEHPNIVPYGTAFSTRDGLAIVVAVGSDRQFAALCACLGIPALPEDVRFTHNQSRVKHRKVLLAELETHFLKHDRDPLLVQLHLANVPAGAVRDMQDVFSQAFAEASILHGKNLKGVRTVALKGIGAHDLSEPPHLGADTEAILAGFLAYSPEKIASLHASDTVG